MPFMTNLKPALIRFGLGPYLEEVPGWQTRGSSAFAPACTIGHHTAGPLSGDRPSLNICVNGRTDLPGPLCNDFLSRTKIILVAAGRANHAGTGGYRGLTGNSAALGNEAESTGVLRKDGTPDWSEFQEWAFPRVHAAHLWLLGRGPEWYIGHRDWTTRKIDPTAIDTLNMRRQIADVMANPLGDDMPDNATIKRLLWEVLQQDDVRGGIASATVKHPLSAPADKRGAWSLNDRLPAIDVGLIALHQQVAGLQGAVSELSKALGALAAGQDLDADKLVTRIDSTIADRMASVVQVKVSVDNPKPTV